jgi:hypothetical protein
LKVEVTLVLTVEADDLEDAQNLGISAAEHLTDTFNDNGSIDPLVGVSVSALPKQ